MNWMLRLYPPRWRRRYGEEFLELMASQPLSVGAAIDVVAGAIDAWVHPELSPKVQPTPNTKGDRGMLANKLRLKCAGGGPAVSAEDTWKSAAVMLGGCLLLTLVWFWATTKLDDNPYIEALSPMAFFIPLLLSQRYTTLKGHSAAAQAIFIVGMTMIVTGIFLLAGWITTRI